MSDATAADYSPEQPFSILKRGSIEPAGPYSQEDILALLNGGEISIYDMVFYQGLGEWKPLMEVFEVEEQISHFVDDGQDLQKVGLAFRDISNVALPGEDIFYIAVQAKAGLLTKAKDCIALTSRHLFILHDRKGSFELEPHPWATVSNTLMRDEGKGLGTFSLLLDGDKRVDLSHFPLKQVQRLFQISQEIKEAQKQA
ncbi:MAG: hypothetical protein AAF236_14245 [Verrucomicrobiota bacterium]